MKQLYQKIIQEWWERPLPAIIPRETDLTDFVSPNATLNKVVTLTGFRRTGKTYLLLALAAKLGQRNCVYINFEDERIPQETQSLTALLDTIEEISDNPKLTLLLDEVQNIPNWGKWVRRINETKQYQLVLTGSSSKLSSNELPTELRGRSLNVHVAPLNFREFAKFKNVDLKNVSQEVVLRNLREFLTYGGLPEVVLAEEGKKYLLLDEYLQTFVRRDIIERYKLRVENQFTALLNLILNSTEYTVGKLTDSLNSVGFTTSKATVSRYLSHLEKSYFLHSLYLHNANVKNRMQASKKCYFVDSFFVTRLAGAFSQNTGRLMEHKVFEKLLTRSREKFGDTLYYWRNQQKYEVDFVVRKGEKVIELVQVSYIVNGGLLPEREVRNLILAGKNLGCTNLTLVTWDLKKMLERSGFKINFIPLAEFLG
ncbi:MAG: ATP-binding protein [Patescibacteria group bacterium]